MRLLTSFSGWPILLLLSAAGAAYGETIVSLGATSGTGSGCALNSGGTCTLTARVTGITPATVTWDFSPAVSGAIIGTASGPDATGLTTITYKAPVPVVSRQSVTVTATAVDGTKASQLITLVPPSVTVTVTPSTTQTLLAGQTQRFTATVSGISQTGVTWSVSPAGVGSYLTNGNTLDYTAPNPITVTQTITITATSVYDTTASGSGKVQLNVPGVSISPATVSLSNSQTQQFTATVTNLASPAVTWSISPAVGTIDQNGLYTAPATIAASQKVTVTATSAADPTKSATATVTLTTTITVGAGAPTEALAIAFQAAWNRNGFNAVTTLPPVGMVRAFGTAGYVQEFTDATTSTLRDALVTGSSTLGQYAIFQILAPLWSYYSSTSANTAGYPLGDSMNCSALDTACVWDLFDKSYALFSYTATLPNGLGPNFSVNGTFYTEWTAQGGINGLGSPISAQTANVTAGMIATGATAATTATVQSFARGAIYSITNNGNRGKVFTVLGQIYTQYVAQGGPSGSLGMPTSEAYQYSTSAFRQNFEGGVLEASGGGTTVLYPVASVTLSGAQAGGTVTLNVGQTLTLTATPILTTGDAAPDRAVSWSTTNGKVVTIQATGGTATVAAVGAGSASVQASSQGISSAKVSFVVIAPCCQVGDGAPAAVQSAFQDALTRNKVTAQTPLASPAQRVANGYIQMVTSADGKTTYLVAISDRVGAAYVVWGALLAKYQALGGPAGPLGYPAGDASAGGTQLFVSGAALGGNPVRLVEAPIVTKWALLNYENGAAGLPISDAAPFSTFGANTGEWQRFSKGAIYGATSGPRAGQAYLVSGLILARYEALGGASGDFGMPTSEEFATGALRQQNFEGGNFTYSTGDAAAVEHAAPRTPGVTASPGSVPAGGRARIAVTGFPNGSTLRISVTGSADFTATAVNGAYSWDMAIALTARSGAVSIRAMDGNGNSADGTLTVKGFADNRIQITKAQGDGQVGLPGAALPVSLRVVLADGANTPVAGAPVTFAGSAGVQLSATSAVTDGAGRAEVYVRLPASAGTALINASSPGIAQTPVTFAATATASALTNFPKLTMEGDAAVGNGTASIARKGALLTAVASILQYYQNRGDVNAPNGAADPASLNAFLKQNCVVDTRGASVCDGFLTTGAGAEQVVNLWRAAEFTGGLDVVARSATAAEIVNVLSDGSPALVSLSLTRNGAEAGGHFVTAVGIASDGSVIIQDPNPSLGRSSLDDYLHGFTAGGVTWMGELRGVVEFTRRSPAATRFVMGAVSQARDLVRSMSMDIQSGSGSCGVPIELGDAVDGTGAPSGGLITRLRACDGGDAVYQVAVGTTQSYQAFLTDLASAGSTFDVSGSAPAVYKATRSKLNLTLAPLDAGFSADAVVNAASFTPGVAPGGAFSIFGNGLAGGGGSTTVTVDGAPATVLLASPFQVNAVAPAEVGAGQRVVEVRSAYGTAKQSVTVLDFAPGIFLMESPSTGAVVNYETGLVNGPTAAAARGGTLVIYATGLGATVTQGGYDVAATPVVVVLNGRELNPSFAGRTPGFAGLYQVNVAIPANTPPGVGLALTLKQGGRFSNTVAVTVQ